MGGGKCVYGDADQIILTVGEEHFNYALNNVSRLLCRPLKRGEKACY